MLEGLETAWYSTQGDNQVTFRNIPHGNYVFKVKTRFRNQEWNENAEQLTVVIMSNILCLVCLPMVGTITTWIVSITTVSYTHLLPVTMNMHSVISLLPIQIV